MKTKRNKVPPTTPESIPVTPPVTPPVPPVTPPEETIPVTPPVPVAIVAGLSLPFSSPDAKACARYYSLALSAKGDTLSARIDAYRTAVDQKPAKDPAIREAVFSAMRGLTREDWGKVLTAEGATPGVILPSDETREPAIPSAGRKVKVRPPVKEGTIYGVTRAIGGDIVRVRATPNETKDGTAVSSFSCVLVNAVGDELTAEDHTGKRVPLTVRVSDPRFLYPDTYEAAESLATELRAAITCATQPVDPATLTTGETVRVWDLGASTSTPFGVPSEWRWEGTVTERGTSFSNVVSRIEAPADRVQWEPPAFITRVPKGLSPLAENTYRAMRDTVESLARTMYQHAGLDDGTVRAAVTAIRGNIVNAYPRPPVSPPVEGADNATTGGEG